MEEIKKSLDVMTHEITKVAKQQRGLHEVLDEVKQLKALIQEKDKKLNNWKAKLMIWSNTQGWTS